MYELKTRKNNASVSLYLDQVEDPQKREDCKAILKLREEVTGEKATMWGTSFIGFGGYNNKYLSGSESKWFITGFAPRKQNLTIYIMPGFKRYGELMAKLGKCNTGKACLYFKKLDDLNVEVLKVLVKESVDYLVKKHSG